MRRILSAGMDKMGLRYTDSTLDAFELYAKLLVEKNKVMNLTAITEDDQIASLHFLDSLSLLTAIDLKEKKLIDVGCGAGFPGLPLKIAEPSVQLTLLDSLTKRIDWLAEVCTELDLDVECISARAEEQALKAGYFESFDYAVSRAVARLTVLCELCMPYVKAGGAFIAMKALDCDGEISEAEAAIKLLGGKSPRIFDYPVYGADAAHRLVIIEKTSSTPKGYPRRFNKIKKEPIKANVIKLI